VVLPTPPFWFAMATTFISIGIGGLDSQTLPAGVCAGNQNRCVVRIKEVEGFQDQREGAVTSKG